MRISFVFCLIFFSIWAQAQSLLSTQGQDIVNEQGEVVILRGMGLGGWMLQEGYMLKTASFANPQHQIMDRIVDVVGQEKMEAFYDKWLENHVTKEDIDSLSAWGFNSVRLPMHYNLYTLPIEEEPVPGQNTWLDKGFDITDDLIAWCADNEMYVILDMHATPGGQGFDEGISDYDPSKPSLFESQLNQEKLASLWKKLAERYKDEKWVAGYDLINEPNWNLPGGTLLRAIYGRVTDSIRTVDQEHILFIEGNWFANDFTGLTPPWDEQLVYSPHKYWSTNDQESIQWVLDIRETHNVPLYLGESGENSNQWFRDAIHLLESHNIGWAWWPMKKVDDIAGPLSATRTDGYQDLLNYWGGTGPKPSPAVAEATLMELADNFKMQNCTVEPGVIDAMFRQVQSDETLPYTELTIPGTIHSAYYDLGSDGNAYNDLQSGNFHVSTGNFTAWNSGWTFRNDGVDMEPSMDPQNDLGVNVGWLDKGEWMKYTLQNVETGRYRIELRTAGGQTGGRFHFEADGAVITDSPTVNFTGDFQGWQTTTIQNVAIYDDMESIVFYVDNPGFNVGHFEFVKIGEITDLPTIFQGGKVDENTIISFNTNKYLNQDDQTLKLSDFIVSVNGNEFVPVNASFNEGNERFINLVITEEIIFSDIVRVSYSGNEIASIDGSELEPFTNELVKNNLPSFFIIPTRIQAEDYTTHEGIQLETTTDAGGGQNIGFLDVGDYADYDVFIPQAGSYRITYRNASEGGSGAVRLSLIDENNQEITIDETSFSSTGGWQTWFSTESNVSLPSGRFTMRLTITQPLFNINWMDFDLLSSTNEEILSFDIYPNPVGDLLILGLSPKKFKRALIIDVAGQQHMGLNNVRKSFNVSSLLPGYYILRLEDEEGRVYVSSFIKA